VIDLIGASAAAAPTAVNLGVLLTGLLLGVRHGIDWDHIAAITDITSTTAAAGMADAAHVEQHRDVSGHSHVHGGERELRAHDAGPGGATLAPSLAGRPAVGRTRFLSGQADAIRLGTLYALGHGAVVVALGLAAIAFGALLPEWLDPLMGRIVGVTLVALGLWVMYSIYRYARAGERFRLRSRWMIVFDAMRYGWRRFQARLHGHEHVEPLEMSSYGARTSFGVGVIHGIGADRLGRENEPSGYPALKTLKPRLPPNFLPSTNPSYLNTPPQFTCPIGPRLKQVQHTGSISWMKNQIQHRPPSNA
jgi:hypothetical protein